jgi:hypothetical protein
MRLLFHQFRKDFRQTWIIWALWFFFVLVQFGLAAWTVNPSDLMGAGLYGQIIGMVPVIHAILLFVLIPLLVFQEPPVGTTATWLTRPMPPVTVLGSKLISFGLLVLLPLLGQCVVLAAHHVVFQDVVLAGLEIALKELSWIALATGLAVLCPNFGTFLVAAAALYVLQYCSGWIWSWIDLIPIHAPPAETTQPSPFLGQSRIVVVDLLWITFGLGVVFLQYLTRRTRRALVLGVCGLLATGIIARYWPWDFVNLLSKKPAIAHAPFDASSLRFLPISHGTSQQNDPHGVMTQTTLSVQFNVLGLPPEENLTLESEGGEQTFPNGSKLTLKPNTNPSPLNNIFFNGGGFRGGYGGGNDSLVAGVEKAIGYLPILNEQFNAGSTYNVQDLFTVDSSTFNQKGTDLGIGQFRLKGQANGYRIVAEISLNKGEFFSDQSKRTTLTEILRTDDGVNLVLRERSLNLLLGPPAPGQAAQPTYLLLNRKRSEALWSENNGGGIYGNQSGPGGLLSAFDLGDNRFEVFSTTTLSFHPQEGDNRPLPVPIDAAWLADAVLVRVEPEPHGDFTASVRIPDFALDGHTLPNGNENLSDEPDMNALRKIALPPQPTRPEVWRYITHILYASSWQRNSNNDDPQVDMLAQVGPAHATDLLIAATTFNGYNYPHFALKSMDLTGQEDFKKMLFRLLPFHTDLIDLITTNHWEKDAKPILLARVINRPPGENIDDTWLDVLALSHDDPAVKAAILDLLRSQQGVIRIVIDQHWEADAKPILISVIAHTKPGSPIDDRWVQVLDSFHDDSRVKAMLLRVLPSDQGAIATVVQNHWENDAKPILLETLNNARRGDTIDDRWFRVLASLSDQSGVKEAVLRVLPFCPNAIEAVIQDHWEMDALPTMLSVLSRLKPNGEGGSVDERWFPALNVVADQPGVKEAILRILPFSHDAITVVIQNHWETDARPILIATLNKAKPGDNFDERWYSALDVIADQPGVKEAVMRILPFIHEAISVVIDNHWEAEARPVLLGALNKAKPGENFDGRWFEVLDSLPDKTGYKEAVLHILPFAQNVANTVYHNHWESDAQPIVLDVLTRAKPEDRFDNAYISLAAIEPPRPGLKEAILRILPANEEAIDFITRYHWEADAKSLLLQKLSSAVFGQPVNRKWIQALAAIHDPSIYPLLLTYTENNLNNFHNPDILDDIRPLPASMVLPLVNRAWKAVQGTDNEPYALVPVAKWGFTDALDRSAAILSEPQETDRQKLGSQQWHKSYARQAFNVTTPCPTRLLDIDLVAWYTTQKTNLAFDPGLNRFLFHPKPLSNDLSWPSADNTMKALGESAAAGDAGAFAEIAATLERATEGLDPKQDAEKIQNTQGELGSSAFSVFQNAAQKNPGIFTLLESANQQPVLRRFVVDIYGPAAAAGNDTALDALLHYQTHQWDLMDVVNNLAGSITNGNEKAIAFAETLPADPKCTSFVLNRASDELLNTANAGNEAARNAYRSLQKSRTSPQD